MSFLSDVGHFFANIGKLVGKALSYAAGKGLTDEVVKTALVWVRVAENKFVTDPEKRAFVLQLLVNKGLPESIARIAIELAYQLFQKEFDKVIPPTT